MLKRKLFSPYVLFFIVIIISLSASTSFAGNVTLSWNAPSTNTDGTPLNDLGGYKVYYGNASGNYSQSVNVGNVTTYTVSNLTAGLTYYFAVTAYDTSTTESAFSNEVIKTIPTTTAQQYTLAVNKAGTGTGVVTSSPSGINCGSDCSEPYNTSNVVTLTAAPSANSTFAGWSGACTGTGTCTVTMNAAKSVTATFTLKTYAINATAGTGGSISPSGTVSANYGANQTFAITAGSGYSIANVLVDGSSVGAVSSYIFSNVTANHTISATFTTTTPNTYTLSVAKAGTGTGAVTSSPSGVNCGSDCSEPYNTSNVVTLTAAASANSTFAGWSGACTGTGTCTVTMNAAKSVTATFTLKTYAIDATAGTGGSISPSGTVSANYGANQTFAITAGSGYSIANVLVDGSSVGAVASYIFSNITANHTISATFTTNSATSVKTYTLTVANSGMGLGTITSSPTGISCGSACSYAYNAGNVVTLTAAASANSTFAGWSGACTGTGTCTVTMNAAKSVTATFTLKTYTINATAGTGGSISPSGTVSVNPGSYQTFTITANTDSSIANVLVDGSSVGAVASYTFPNVAANHTISASFTGSESFQSASVFDLPRTGQTLSYAPGDDGSIQAGIEWPSPRFTDSGDGTVRDNLTGLMWLKDGGCLKKKWNDALQTIADLNVNPGAYTCLEYSANYSDWRLPNIKELESLVDYGAANPAQWLNSSGFNNIKSNYYWSSTSYKSTMAWIISMNKGVDKPISKSKSYYMLPVRASSVDTPYELPKTGQTLSYAPGDDGQAGIEWPSPRFTDSGDGTVRDNLTGLMWLKDGGCLKKKWNDALQTIADLNVNPGAYTCLEYSANYSDWRLPNIKELESLVDYGATNVSAWLNTEGFLNTLSSKYWSSTAYLTKTSSIWVVNMKTGDMSSSGKKSKYRILPVRDGRIKDGNLQ